MLSIYPKIRSILIILTWVLLICTEAQSQEKLYPGIFPLKEVTLLEGHINMHTTEDILVITWL
jgi:hypothetical protein